MAKSTADYEAAARKLEKAKQLAPQWQEVYHNLGMLYEKTGNYDGAIENFRGYLKLVPTSPSAAIPDYLPPTAALDEFLEFHGQENDRSQGKGQGQLLERQWFRFKDGVQWRYVDGCHLQDER